jgi:hypothetical protein
MSSISMVEARLPPGFRFHPRDDELVVDYLCRKLSGKGGAYGGINMIDVDLNKCEPWDLPGACLFASSAFMSITGSLSWHTASLEVAVISVQTYENQCRHSVSPRSSKLRTIRSRLKQKEHKKLASPGLEPETFSVLD